MKRHLIDGHHRLRDLHRRGLIEIDCTHIGDAISVAHAVTAAARDKNVWIIYKTAYGIFADRQGEETRFKQTKLIATVRHVSDNIVDVTYESDKRVERLYV